MTGVAAHHGDHRRSRPCHQHLFQQCDEVGAGRLAADQVANAPAGKVQRAEDGAPPVGAGGHHPLAGTAHDPGGPHPGQQVAVGLIFGQHDRVAGQLGELGSGPGRSAAQRRVALGDQPGPPPAGDLAHAPVQGALADRRSPESLPPPRNGPRPGLGQQPTDPLGQPRPRPGGAGQGGAGPPGRARPGGWSGGSSGGRYRGGSRAARRWPPVTSHGPTARARPQRWPGARRLASCP